MEVIKNKQDALSLLSRTILSHLSPAHLVLDASLNRNLDTALRILSEDDSIRDAVKRITYQNAIHSISSFRKGGVCSFPFLEKLDLSFSSGIGRILRGIALMDSVRTLILTRTDLSSYIEHLPASLEHLDLTGTRVMSLSPDLRLSRLRKLYISNTPIKVVSFLTRSPQLEVLVAKRVPLQCIMALEGKTNLRTLAMTLPPNDRGRYAINLRFLSLSCFSHLEISGYRVLGLESAKVTDDAYVKIANTPIANGDLKFLGGIGLSSLSLQSSTLGSGNGTGNGKDIPLKDIGSCRPTRLKLADSFLASETLDNVFFMVIPAVTRLDLQCNRLTTLDFMQSFPNLTHLQLQHNGIVSISELNECQRLKVVNLEHNQITNFDILLSAFPDLYEVNVSRNPLRITPHTNYLLCCNTTITSLHLNSIILFPAELDLTFLHKNKTLTHFYFSKPIYANQGEDELYVRTLSRNTEYITSSNTSLVYVREREPESDSTSAVQTHTILNRRNRRNRHLSLFGLLVSHLRRELKNSF